MHVYKVYFQNNKPISAVETGASYFENVQEDLLKKDGSVSWIPVIAKSKEDSITIANKIIAAII